MSLSGPLRDSQFEFAFGAADDVVAMQTRRLILEGAGEIPLRRLVKEALWIRPRRGCAPEAPREAGEVRMAAGCAPPVGSSPAVALPPGMHGNVALVRLRGLASSRGKRTLAAGEPPFPLANVPWTSCAGHAPRLLAGRL